METPSNHPFFEWYAGLARIGGAAVNGKGDVVLTDVGGRRFALGVHEGKPVLACMKGDVAALRSVSWTKAAIAMSTNGKDWIALWTKNAAADPNAKGGGASSPWSGMPMRNSPMRLWIPVTSGRLSVWTEEEVERPESLLIGEYGKKKGVPHLRGTPFAEIPLSLKEG